MRKHLFRGKCIDGGKWVYGAYYHQAEFYGDSCDKHYIIESKDALEDNMMIYYEVEPLSVSEFTGLVDKNNKLIFEGDIHRNEQYMFVVQYGKYYSDDLNYDGYGWHLRGINCTECFGFYGDEFNYIDIVGNMCDNPDLLGGGQHV